MTAASGIPTKFSVIFGSGAATGNITTPIPVTTSSPGRASLTTGYPATNFTVGGTPPDGRDVNGIENMLSAWAQWQAAGGPIAYDSAFSTAIGGYPKGSIIGSATTAGKYYLNTTDNNTSNPDSGGANWRTLTYGFQNLQLITATSNFTVPAGVYLIKIIAVGAGGGGSNSIGTTPGANNSSGAGGGAGGCAFGYYLVTPGQVIAITIGSGGAAQTAGGTTTVTGFCSATGGQGTGFATANSSPGGVGGTATGGQLNLAGGTGSDGQNGAFTGFGNGAASIFGGQGRAGFTGGVNGQAYGAGGGGSYGGVGTGGSGANGVVIVEY